MVTVFVCGNRSENFNNRFYNALEEYGGLQIFSEKKIYSSCKNPKYIVYENRYLPHTNIFSGIVIFKNKFYCNKDTYLKGFIPILDSQNTKAVNLLKNNFSIAITCGLSLKDTLYPSSINYPNNIISLQRDILTVSGKVTEAHDFKVTLKKPTSIFTMLSICGVLLLSDIPSNDGYKF